MKMVQNWFSLIKVISNRPLLMKLLKLKLIWKKLNSSNKLKVGHFNINYLRNKFRGFHQQKSKYYFIVGKKTWWFISFNTNYFKEIWCSIQVRQELQRWETQFLHSFFYFREDIPNLLQLSSGCSIESICIEINSRKREWFINGSYNPSKSVISNHFEWLNPITDKYSKMYQSFMFLSDFNAPRNGKFVDEFCNLSGLTSLIKKQKYWQTYMQAIKFFSAQ